jgi:hypothetical protein
VLFALLVWKICIWFFEVHPPVGANIAALAFLASIVTLWPLENRWPRAFWLLVLLGLTILETSVLYRDSKELETAREKETAAFSLLL